MGASMTIAIVNGTRILNSLGCSGYNWSDQTTPNTANLSDRTFHLPTVVDVCKSSDLDQVPYLDSRATRVDNLDLDTPVMGILGLSLDGVSIFGPTDAEMNEDGSVGRDAVVFEGKSLNECGSHADPSSELHYHAHPGVVPSVCNVTDPSVMYLVCEDNLENEEVCSALTSGPWQFYSSEAQSPEMAFGNDTIYAFNHSLLLGFYMDGIPLYGFEGSDGMEPVDLDNCSGHNTDLPFYHYHATRTYPYLAACLRGKLDPSTNTGSAKWNDHPYKMTNSCTSGYDTYNYSNILPSWSYPLIFSFEDNLTINYSTNETNMSFFNTTTTLPQAPTPPPWPAPYPWPEREKDFDGAVAFKLHIALAYVLADLFAHYLYNSHQSN